MTNRWAISRIETLSDGVFAIAITLLVLLRARGDKASAATSG
ncbi:MAG TPA: TMEM175 family protein [Solirubrobacteraceae bacterium]|nr:TMEM175 family protein [Solirubrobacteraceae bacterium]